MSTTNNTSSASSRQPSPTSHPPINVLGATNTSPSSTTSPNNVSQQTQFPQPPIFANFPPGIMLPPPPSGSGSNAQNLAQYQNYMSQFAHMFVPTGGATNGQQQPPMMPHPQMLQMYAFLYPSQLQQMANQQQSNKNDKEDSIAENSKGESSQTDSESSQQLTCKFSF
jgi:hypothetical protein